MTEKYYTFSVPCEYFYTVEASNEKEARELLIKERGLSGKGELQLEKHNYTQAELLDVVGEDNND
tara:strand:- start:38 stop:232 length:195 start_codon:yes stop_codon:yes gene_type:complete